MIELLLIKAGSVIAKMVLNASEGYDTGMVFEMDGTCDTFTLSPVQ